MRTFLGTACRVTRRRGRCSIPSTRPVRTARRPVLCEHPGEHQRSGLRGAFAQTSRNDRSRAPLNSAACNRCRPEPRRQPSTRSVLRGARALRRALWRKGELPVRLAPKRGNAAGSNGRALPRENPRRVPAGPATFHSHSLRHPAEKLSTRTFGWPGLRFPTAGRVAVRRLPPRPARRMAPTGPATGGRRHAAFAVFASRGSWALTIETG